MDKVIEKPIYIPSTQGKYNGLWRTEDNSAYYLVYEKNGTVIVSSLPFEINKYDWEMFEGTINGKSFRVESTFSLVKSVSNGVFTSDTRAELVQVSCSPVTPNSYCLYPDGFKLVLNKVF